MNKLYHCLINIPYFSGKHIKKAPESSGAFLLFGMKSYFDF